MKPIILLAAVIILSGCASTSPSDAERVVLMNPDRGSANFQVCSRPMVTGADSFFTPAPQDITALENDLARVLSASAQDIGPAASFASAPSNYRREYIGYVSDGQRMVYGNFVPSGMKPDSAPTVICDGGPALFGVEYSVARRAVTAIRFDGTRGGTPVPDIIR